MFSFHTLLLTEAVGETLIVAPRADGIGFRYTDLQAELNRILRVYDSPQTEAPIRNLVVDLGELRYFGTEFLGSILTLMNRTAQRGGKAVWCNANEDLIRFFYERGVASLWPYFATRSEAVQWTHS